MSSIYSTIDKVVRAALFEMGEMTEHRYDLGLHYAYNFMRDLSLDGQLEPKTVVLDMLKNIPAINLPLDYTAWSKVGFECGNEIVMLGVNNSIMYPHSYDDCGNLVKSDDNCGCNFNGKSNNGDLGYATSFFNYGGNGGLQTLYGYGGYWNGKGYFKEFKDKGQIVFSSEVPRTIVLEYVTDGINYSGATLVPKAAETTIKEYVKWCFAKDNDSMPENKVERKRREYYNERTKTIVRINKVSLRDFVDACREGRTQTARF